MITLSMYIVELGIVGLALSGVISVMVLLINKHDKQVDTLHEAHRAERDAWKEDSHSQQDMTRKVIKSLEETIKQSTEKESGS